MGNFLQRRRDHRRWGVLGALGVAVVVVLWVVFFWQKDVTVQVEARSWSRAQEVERYSCDDLVRLDTEQEAQI